MRNYLFCVTCLLHMAWALGYPGSKGVGAFSYSDSSGRRLGGTYDVDNGQVFSTSGDYPVPFADPFQGFGYGYPGNYFFPTYFANLDNYLQDGYRVPRGIMRFRPFRPLRPLPPLRPLRPLRPFRRAFDTNAENQMLAFDAARKAFDLTSNMGGYGYIPNFDHRFNQFNEFPAFGGFPNMPNLQNSAFASTMARPGFSHQVASITPDNPAIPNIDKVHRNPETPSNGGFMSVSSKSYVSSTNVNGEEKSHRGAETVVNDNGKITQYKVES